jgi:hypothetical protein
MFLTHPELLLTSFQPTDTSAGGDTSDVEFEEFAEGPMGATIWEQKVWLLGTEFTLSRDHIKCRLLLAIAMLSYLNSCAESIQLVLTLVGPINVFIPLKVDLGSSMT